MNIWVRPISTQSKAPRLHLIPSEGWLVKSLCGRMVNRQFATDAPRVKRCETCAEIALSRKS